MDFPLEKVAQLVNDNHAAKAAYDALAAVQGQVYIVGGAVRDLLLGKDPKDIDMLVANLPSEDVIYALEQTGGRIDFTGKTFGVFRFRYHGEEVEIALPRVERSTGKGHRDFNVDYDHRIPVEVDLGRRDFTANAMAINLNALETGDYENAFIDPHGGALDISQQTLRLVNPNAFEEDPLRIVRAIVAYARHGLMPDVQTLQALQNEADKVRDLPGERIQAELDKLLTAPDPASAIELAYQSGVLDYILPEVSSAMGFDQQNQWHDLDVGSHLLAALKAMSQISNDPDLRLAALLHDIGKPNSFWLDENNHGHYYFHKDQPGSADHEEVGAQMAEELMKRLHYPNDRIQRVVTLIRNHMWNYFNSQSGARKLLNKLDGDEQMAWDLMRLREADARGKTTGEMAEHDQRKLPQSQGYLQKVLDDANATTVKDLAINGNDLINLGMEPGPALGKVLNELLAEVLESPEKNNKEYLLERAKELM